MKPDQLEAQLGVFLGSSKGDRYSDGNQDAVALVNRLGETLDGLFTRIAELPQSVKSEIMSNDYRGIYADARNLKLVGESDVENAKFRKYARVACFELPVDDDKAIKALGKDASWALHSCSIKEYVEIGYIRREWHYEDGTTSTVYDIEANTTVDVMPPNNTEDADAWHEPYIQDDLREFSITELVGPVIEPVAEVYFQIQ